MILLFFTCSLPEHVSFMGCQPTGTYAVSSRWDEGVRPPCTNVFLGYFIYDSVLSLFFGTLSVYFYKLASVSAGGTAGNRCASLLHLLANMSVSLQRKQTASHARTSDWRAAMTEGYIGMLFAPAGGRRSSYDLDVSSSLVCYFQTT